MQKEVRDIIILGAGPSGLFCGLHLPKQAKILFLEKTEKSASKLLLSAKGRGNLTNLQIDPKQDYVSDDPAFVHSAFEKYGVREFLQFLAENGFPTQEEANGRILLQSGKVSQFHEFLINETEKQGRIIAYQQDVKKVERNAEGTFTVQTTSQQFIAHKVILATGTKSVPALGSSDIALQIAQDFNLPFRVFFPALVGFETENNLSPLAGSSVIGKGELYVNEKKVYEQIWPILFTHRGISGPIVFNASLSLHPPVGGEKILFKLQIKKADITKRFLAYLGFRLNLLTEYTFTTRITGTRGFEEAKVCSGGIQTQGLQENFEVKIQPGLFIIGECLDCTGKTGGFNLQRCRTSGAVCGKEIASKDNS